MFTRRHPGEAYGEVLGILSQSRSSASVAALARMVRLDVGPGRKEIIDVLASFGTPEAHLALAEIKKEYIKATERLKALLRPRARIK